jgi:ribonuclease BN (tRNA processing enzyme)
VGRLRIRFHAVPHYLTTHAIDVSSNGRRFTFGADCRPTDELTKFARGTDLLMVEATLPRPERAGVRGHLTPAEAGEHGRKAQAGRLVLTHISDELDELWARTQAQRTFGGPVSVAREGAVYRL